MTASHFPFSAIVGQELLRRALLLGAIQPSLGGVLIRGTKGVAKSTAVRALAALLPPIETVADCPFRRRPGEAIAGWPLPADAPVVHRAVPLVELPLGATEDRVLGALHLEKALRGERAFEPGLLAAANRGMLYIDEVNLLPDHLVDLLLDAAASGTHRLEREGLSLSHPARFLLIGTMNPEEGELRPQLLDRFGLAADVTDLTDAADRAEAVRRRLEYEADPERFADFWSAAEAAEGERIQQAQRLLPEVCVSNEILKAVSERCLAARVEGLRADLTLCKAACAWAAYQGRMVVEAADVDAVAELALAHRRRQPPEPPRSGGQGPGSKRPAGGNGSEPKSSTQAGSPAAPLLHFESAGLFAARVEPSSSPLSTSTSPGGWRGTTRRRGAGLPRRCTESAASVAWAATLRNAALHQIDRGRCSADGLLVLRPEDLVSRPPRGPAGCLLLFVVDASGSMAASRRMRQTKAAVLALLLQAYQQRDRVAILAFRGQDAEVVLPPTRGLGPARRALEALPVGGPTPLAHGLAAACRLLRNQQRRHPHQPVWTVLLTDGRANHALTADPWQDTLVQARVLRAAGTECLVVDTETGWPHFGRAAELAVELGAKCVPLEEVLGRELTLPRSEVG
jgi:magnesium chelatase subunit D